MFNIPSLKLLGFFERYFYKNPAFVMFLSLVFPCFNEEKAIDTVLPQALQLKKQLLKSKKCKKMEILLVDDGSSDSSFKKAQKYSKEIVIVRQPTNQGYGQALKAGFEKSSGDFLAFCDLDDSYQVKDLELLIDRWQKAQGPIVWGDRLHKNSEIPFLRHLGNRLYQILFKLLTFKKVPDPCSGLRLFKKSEFWPAIQKLPKDLSFSLALSAYCLRLSIRLESVPVSYKSRKGSSKLRVFRDGFVFLYQMLWHLFFKRF